MPPDFEAFAALQRHGVPFVIVGGHAVNRHGFARATEDSDAVWLRSSESEGRLLAALTELGAEYISSTIDPATGIERCYPVSLPFIQGHHLMMLFTKAGFLDLFDFIPGAPTENVDQLFMTSVEFGGFRFASLDWLRRMKSASGRSKDLTDLENLVE